MTATPRKTPTKRDDTMNEATHEEMQTKINELTFRVNQLENAIRAMPDGRGVQEIKDMVGMRRATDKPSKLKSFISIK